MKLNVGLAACAAGSTLLRTIGAMQVLGVPVKLSDTPGGIETPPPRLGEHTEAVLSHDLGLDTAAIAALRAQGAI